MKSTAGVTPTVTVAAVFGVAVAAAATATAVVVAAATAWRPGPGPGQPMPSGTARAVMNIKHPCNPKPVCSCIPIALKLQAGLHDFNISGIYLEYSKCIPGLEIADSERIYLVYPKYIPFS